MQNLILFLPLLNFIALLISDFLGIKGTIYLNLLCIFGTFVVSVYILKQTLFNIEYSPIFLPIWIWIDVELLQVEFGGFFDSLTAIMLFVVTFISLLVHIYSCEYMKNDPHLQRFLAYLSLFTFFMIVLVTSNNFIQLFTGWEGVGICSYLLINFWFTRIQANKAAIKAVIVNRIGDTAFAIAIFLIFKSTGSVDFSTVFLLTTKLNNLEINTICFFLFLGAMGKSAQIGLHTWLPDAMEGPTPVSALIHAATMVTAGVFLIVRCSFLFQEANLILPLMTIVGSLTTFFAATTALVQTDLKRVIAYSTCSQLGYMITACGLSAYNASIFHLSNHAFFKALLFLSAGSVIHAMNNEQDMRKMGGLINLLPFTYCMILIGSLALMGFPFLSGFYSKDVILETAYASYSISGHFAFWLGSLSALFTSFYSVRLIFLTFLNDVNSSKVIIQGVHDAPFLMALPMMLLSIFSIFIGYFTKDIFVGLGTPFWGNSLSFSATNYLIFIEIEFLPFYIKILPVIFSTSGTFLAIIYYKLLYINFNILKNNKGIYYIYNFLNKKWYFDKMYNEFIIQNFISLGYNFTYQSQDRGFLEIFGPKGLNSVINNISLKINKIQTGLAYHYSVLIFFGFLTILVLITGNSLYIELYLILLILV